MIDYDPELWGVAFIFRISGSVFPKALPWAIPSAALAACLHVYFHSEEGHELEPDEGIRLGISSYNVALSFLVIFRTQQAYSRWWEGGTLLQTMRGEWYNAYSNLLSFTTRELGRRADVDAFQHRLVRFMSLLHGTALQQVSTTPNLFFELMDLRGVDARHLEFLKDCEDRCEVVMQWVQRITVEAFEGGVLPIPAPILSRVFQELSRGIVNLANARKISELPFPYPYAQMITVTLMIHWAMMPVLMAHLCRDAWWAGILTFVTVFWNWSLNYVAQEIESPFGDDANDLPLVEMQKNFNRMLAALIMQEAQAAPRFVFEKGHRRMGTTNLRSGTFSSTEGLDIGVGGPAPNRAHVLRTQASFQDLEDRGGGATAEEVERVERQLPQLCRSTEQGAGDRRVLGGAEAETLSSSNRCSRTSTGSAGPWKREWDVGKRAKKRPSRFSQANFVPDAARRRVQSLRLSHEGGSDDGGEQPAEARASTRSSRSNSAVSDMGVLPGSGVPSPRGPSRPALTGSGASTPDSVAMVVKTNVEI